MTLFIGEYMFKFFIFPLVSRKKKKKRLFKIKVLLESVEKMGHDHTNINALDSIRCHRVVDS